MFNSVVLNVVIGLVFIYLLYSLLATTVNEALASILNLRAQKLEKAIKRMLDDGVMKHHNVWSFIGDFLKGIFLKLKNFILLFSLKEPSKEINKMSLVDSFYDHPGIKYLGENKISNKPSYISPEFFSKALIDVIKDKACSPNDTAIKQVQVGLDAISNSNETKKFIQSLLTDGNNDLEKFKTSLEQWFNETMNRTSGWYKKQNQRITFLIGFVLAISFNVDTISIVKKLSNDPNAAEALANVATKYVETHKDSSGHLLAQDTADAKKLFADAKKQVNEDIYNANSVIGLGWDIPSDTNTCLLTKNALNLKQDSLFCKLCLKNIKTSKAYTDSEGKLSAFGKVRYVLCMAFSSWRRLLGYLLTAMAISFGAPFWFDLLNKFIQLRTAGKRPYEQALKKK